MKQKIEASIIITTLCLLLGVLIGMQWKTVKKSNAAGGYEQQRVSELRAELRASKNQLESYQKELYKKNQLVQNYEDSAAKDNEMSGILSKELQEARIQAGMIEVEGPGVIVTLNDNTKGATENTEGVDPNVYIVHDEDILKVVNELKAAGAEGISINGQRVVSTSAIRCVGPVVTVNETHLAPPFEISAIGDGQTLATALKLPQGIVDTLKFWGVQVEVEVKDKVTLPQYTQGKDFKYSVPTKKVGE